MVNRGNKLVNLIVLASMLAMLILTLRNLWHATT